MLTQINNVIILMKHDKIVQTSAIVVLFVSFALSLLISVFAGFLVLGNYILGLVVCSLFLQYQTIALGIVVHFINLWKSNNVTVNANLCHVCSGSNCSRHLKTDKTPWKYIRVKKKLNIAVEHFFNTILNQFIESWYDEFTQDVTFLASLRNSIRYSTSIAVNKLLHLDTGKTITDKLIPCAIKHIDDCLCMERNARVNCIGVEQVAIKYLGSRLHVAATNRKNEVEYLRQLSTLLLPKLMPAEYMKCGNFSVFMRELFTTWTLLPLMDVLADPNIINLLVIITIKAIRNQDPKQRVEPNAEMVEFLTNFGGKHSFPSPFGMELRAILKNTDLLYAFMQYLKKEDRVYMLQFCLDLEEFNSTLLTPELSGPELSKLHADATAFYNRYLDPASSCHIGCERRLSAGMRHLLDAGVGSIVRLRTSEPLFAACEHVYATLEKEWLPHFFHSTEFYAYICKSTTSSTISRNASRLGSPLKARNKRYTDSSQGTVAKISSGLGKIKGVLATKQPIDGSLYPPESQQIVESDGSSYIEELSSDCNMFRDMSSWRISIPTVSQQKYGSKLIFNIHIQRNDQITEQETKEWNIQRKDQDFYTLKGKLIEFHGENEICNSPFPSRRSGTNHDIRKSQYETFLRNLLHKPFLRGSDLLHTFLTTNQDFTLLTAAVPMMDLENIYQSVAYKLRKEKGQHLDGFMGTFLSSTEKNRHNKFEWAEISDAMDIATQITTPVSVPKTLHNHIFNDNFGVDYIANREISECSINPKGLTESLFYLLKHIFKVRVTCLRIFAAICSVAQNALESLFQRYLDSRIRYGLNQDNLTYLITLLEEVIFTKHIPATSEELEERKRKAFKDLNNIIPDKYANIVGGELKIGCGKLLEILQNPHLNKHLVYNLLDLILIELYPELNKPIKPKEALLK